MNKILTAYERKSLHDTFLDNVFFVELYILKKENKLVKLDKEKWGDRWESWGKLWKEDSLKKIKRGMEANLFGFRVMLKTNIKKEGLLETRKELKKEFYKWIDTKKINADNCSPKLKTILFNLHEVLKGRGDEWAKQLADKSEKEVASWSEEKWEYEANRGFSAIDQNLENEEQKSIQLEGKNWDEIVLESKFNGHEERGKQTFRQIIESPESLQKERTEKGESDNVNHSKRANENKEFPWKIVIPFSFLGILAAAVMVAVWKRKKTKDN